MPQVAAVRPPVPIPARTLSALLGVPPAQPRPSPLVRLQDVAQGGCSTRGRPSLEVAVWCMPVLGVSGKATGTREGGRDPAALQPALPSPGCHRCSRAAPA